MATFTKLKSGNWGIRVKGSAPRAGQTMAVTKKGGGSKAVIVDRVLWTGKDRDGSTVSLCSIRTEPRRSHYHDGEGCHTDGNCSSMCSPKTCPCGDGSWFSCC